jgi:folate-binding protein YgfZ
VSDRPALPLLLTRSAERVVEVRGADRLAFLDATTTQALGDAPPGTGTAALVLDAHGAPLAMLEVLVLPERVLLVVPDEAGVATVMDVLAGRTFLSDARFAVLDLDVAVLHGDGAEVAAAASGFAVADGAVVEHPDGVLVADARHGARRLVAAADALAAAADALRAAGAGEGGPGELDAWRVAVGEPTWGREVSAPHLPEELGLLPTHVHLSKGCYPGQEAVARMWMLGRPRRRLARVRLEGDAGPGSTIGSARDEVRVTAVLPGADVGLAFVPGGAARGDRFADAGTAVEVLDLPGDDPSPPGHDPAMRRRRDRR